MAEDGKPAAPKTLVPSITQETLVETIGSTRPRGSFFMNRVRTLGYTEHNGRIRVHTSLLSVVLHDELPQQNASRPRFLDLSCNKARTVTERTKLV